MKKSLVAFALVSMAFIACQNKQSESEEKKSDNKSLQTVEDKTTDILLNKYVEVELTTDMSKLSESQKKMIPILINASKVMDELFWMQAYGNKDELLNSIEDASLREFAQINYGPWDRLNGNQSFIDGVGEKPLGANFYPKNMTKQEFDSSDIDQKASLYTLIRRNDSGELISIPYHQAYKDKLTKVADLLNEASELAENKQLKKYLKERAIALLTDDFYESDMTWMDLVDNQLDIIIGPIENYEDQLFGHKAAYEAYVLVKDMEWSKRLSKYAAMLPELQTNLPVDKAYKKEKPGTDSQLAAFDVIYYAGDCNAGSKTIAVNLPNDESIQLKKGTRRSQLKNAMRAKFDKILIPIAEELIDESQRAYINFDAFFANTMFHEVAHGLGIKNTIDGKGTVRAALQEHASAIEEGKADILGLYMVSELHKKGEIEGDIKGYYTTFMASIFRSIRFGTSSAHGKANMIRFNYFKKLGVFNRSEDGTYKIDYDKMIEAMNSLSSHILKLQGNGDYLEVSTFVEEETKIGEDLQSDLERLSNLGIPVDVVFKQGVEVLGL